MIHVVFIHSPTTGIVIDQEAVEIFILTIQQGDHRKMLGRLKFLVGREGLCAFPFIGTPISKLCW